MAMNNWGGVKEHMTRANRKFLSNLRHSKSFSNKSDLENRPIGNKKLLKPTFYVQAALTIIAIFTLTFVIFKILV